MPLPQISRFVTGLVTQRNLLDTPTSYSGSNVVQHYDVLLDGLNFEVTNFGTIKRRPGYTAYGSGYLSAGEVPLNIYSFKNLDGTIRLIVDTTSRVALYDGNSFTTIYAKSAGASYSNAATVGNRIYFADTVSNFKWDGITLSKWGIATPVVAPTITFTPLLYSTFITTQEFPNTDKFEGQIAIRVGKGDFQTATIAANSTLNDIVDILSGGSPAPITASLSSAFFSDFINTDPDTGTGYFTTATYASTGTLPSQYIVGNFVTVTDNTEPSLNTSGTITAIGSNYFVIGAYSATGASGAGGTASVTSPAVNYGIQAYKIPNTTNTAYRIQVVSNTIGSAGQLTLTSSVVDTTNNIMGFQFEVGDGTAALAPSIFYSWVFVYKNSTTQHISTASDPTPQIVSQAIAGTAVLTGPGSTDPQVDQIEIYRTQDGGSTYLYSGTITNTTTWTYVDSVPDSELNINIEAPISNANDPPLLGATDPVFHIDRLWYHVNNILYYTGGPDTTNGVGTEASPPANYIPAYPGRIVKKISTPNGLLIFLEDDVHVVTGLDSASYRSQLLATGLGIKNQFAVIADGQILYAYSTKQQLYQITTNAEPEIGFPIGDLLKLNFPATSTSLTLHRAGSTDNALYVSNGQDTVARYYVDGRSWSPVAKPVMGVSVQRSIEIAPGDIRLMTLLPNAGTQVFYRDTNSYQDADTPYTGFITVGILNLGAPTFDPPTVTDIAANLNNQGTVPILSLLREEISGDFTTINYPVNDPPYEDQGTTLVSKRWYLGNTDVPFNYQMRYLQVKFEWLAENTPNILFGFYLGAKK